MDPGFLLVENFGRFAAAVGLAIAAPLFAYGGYLWMTSMGDPNRSAAARNAVISVAVGIVVIGCSFILPRMVGQVVVGPSGGGVVFEHEPGVNCDRIFRERLIVNRAASTPSRMNFLVRHIQGQFEDCNEALWSPRTWETAADHAGTNQCYSTHGPGVETSISRVTLPRGLDDQVRYRVSRRYVSLRDSRNNILVHFADDGLPSDGSICWMYVSSLDAWVEGYPCP